MTGHVEKPQESKFIRHILVPVLIPLFSALIGFALASSRADSAHDVELQGIQQDIQKVRAMPSPDQIVTKDQLTEIVRRLDDRTAQISRDVEYLREREEKRSH
jgi:hypothetical protein